MAVVVAILAISAQFLATQIPFSVERDLSSDIEKSLFNKKQSEKDKEITAYLQAIADKLAVAEKLPEDITVTLHYSSDATINAFATLGGHIVIFKGIMEKMPGEEALAAVIAHEIAHIKLRHPIMSLGRSVVVGLALAAIAGLTDFSFAQDTIASTGALTTLAFSRAQEKNADKEAIFALVEVYDNVAGAEEMFLALGKLQKDVLPLNIPQFFLTHPDTKSRLADVRKMARQNSWPIDESTQSFPPFVTEELKR